MKKQIDMTILVISVTLLVVAVIWGVTRPTRAIVHGGPLIVTEVTMDEHEAFCRYVVSQQDGDEKHKAKFTYVQRCGMYNAGDHLMLVQGRK